MSSAYRAIRFFAIVSLSALSTAAQPTPAPRIPLDMAMANLKAEEASPAAVHELVRSDLKRNVVAALTHAIETDPEFGPSTRARARAFEALARLGDRTEQGLLSYTDPTIIELFLSELESGSNSGVKESLLAVPYLPQEHHARAVAAMTDLLDHPSFLIVRTSVGQLGLLGPDAKSAMPKLKALLLDPAGANAAMWANRTDYRSNSPFHSQTPEDVEARRRSLGMQFRTRTAIAGLLISRDLAAEIKLYERSSDEVRQAGASAIAGLPLRLRAYRKAFAPPPLTNEEALLAIDYLEGHFQTDENIALFNPDLLAGTLIVLVDETLDQEVRNQWRDVIVHIIDRHPDPDVQEHGARFLDEFESMRGIH